MIAALIKVGEGSENVLPGEASGNGLRHSGISAAWLPNCKSLAVAGGSLHFESHEAAIQ